MSHDAADQHDPARAQPLVLGDDFFLSASNPTATRDQRDIERRAIEMLTLPQIVRARSLATQRFRMLADHDTPQQAWAIFDAVMAEWTYHYVLLALNSDPNYPKVLGHWFGPPHEWFGMQVPGSRGPATAENTDNNYSVIPVDGHSRFEIRGRRFTPPVGDCPMQVTTNLSQSINVSSVDWRDVQFDADGSFLITVDGQPAAGRPNHLQTTLDTKYIFIRDGRVDWWQLPNAYRVRRLDPPCAAPRSDDEIVALATRFIIDDVGPMNFFRRMVRGCAANVLPPIVSSGDVGGMPSQKLLVGRVVLEDDEAFVMRLTLGSAAYLFLGTYNSWLMSGDFWARTTSLNSAQSRADPDGAYSFVLSARDPGVHNWIDTQGMHETLLMARWHQLSRQPDAEEPVASGERVKLSELPRVLPSSTAWVSPAQRQQQQAERLKAFQARYIV